MRTFSDSPYHPNAAISPLSYDHIGVPGIDPCHRYAPWTHNRVKRFDSMNPIPHQVRLLGLDGAGAIDIATHNTSRLWRCFETHRFFPKTQRGRTEPRHASLLSQPCDFTGVVVTVRQWFVDEHRFSGRQYGSYLLQMSAAIQTFQ